MRASLLVIARKPAAHCDASKLPDHEFCFEYTKRDYTDAQAVCKGFPGTWAEGPCSRTNALGVRKLSGGINKIFYAGTTHTSAAAAEMQCGGTWALPDQ